MASEFFITDQQWAAIEPLLPTNQIGAHREDDRRVLSGIVHVLKTGCRWQDTPKVYGPSTTIYNRYNRWSKRGIWQGMFAAVVEVKPGGIQAIDSTTAKAQRASCRRKRGAQAQSIGRSRGGPGTKTNAVADAVGRLMVFTITGAQVSDHLPAPALLATQPAPDICLADAGYDSDALRSFLENRGTLPVIPNNPTRRRFHPFDEAAYRARNTVERMFCRLKDWRRLATRYDKLAINHASAVAIAAIVMCWT